MPRFPIIAAAVLLLGASPALAQKSTEMFIPIGKSPGVSGKSSIIGNIKSVDAEKKTIVIVSGEKTLTIKLTDKTRVWLDRRQSGQRNVEGSAKDCHPGCLIEAKFTKEPGGEGVTYDGIKIAAPAPPEAAKDAAPKPP